MKMGFLHLEVLCSEFSVYPNDVWTAAECETKLNSAGWF